MNEEPLHRLSSSVRRVEGNLVATCACGAELVADSITELQALLVVHAAEAKQ